MAELACALRVPEGSAERLLAESETLVQELTGTRTALCATKPAGSPAAAAAPPGATSTTAKNGRTAA